LPVLRAAVAALISMASFESANVSDRRLPPP
jgi:NaMN:DMB phosphoribosyltransferase